MLRRAGCAIVALNTLQFNSLVAALLPLSRLLCIMVTTVETLTCLSSNTKRKVAILGRLQAFLAPQAGQSLASSYTLHVRPS